MYIVESILPCRSQGHDECWITIKTGNN